MFGMGAEPAKQVSSAECVEAIMKAIQETPSLVRNHVTVITDQQNEDLKRLWSEIFNADNWTRTNTHRPDGKEYAEMKAAEEAKRTGNIEQKVEHWSGTDVVIRTYENEAWLDGGKALEARVISEHGEVVEVLVDVRW